MYLVPSFGWWRMLVVMILVLTLPTNVWTFRSLKLSKLPIMYHKHSTTTKERRPRCGIVTTKMAVGTDQDDGLLSRGDARGAALLLEDVSVFRGLSQQDAKNTGGSGQFIVQDVDWRIEPKAKWGLVGANGCGKSTVLKAIMGEIPYDGTITIGMTQVVGYLQQTAVSGSTKSVFEEAASAQQDIVLARQALEQAQQRLEQSTSPTEQDLIALDVATQQYEMVGCYQQEQIVSTMLQGLGFVNLTQPCNELSGGWQMRVSLAKTLLSQPTLCLLDEPSNHLDRSARQWLRQYLSNYDRGAMILVTHDVELLQSMDHIAEITNSRGTIQIYKSCTYSQYLQQKQDRAQAAWTEYERNQERAAKLQAFVDRFGASATKASAAQSRVKQIEKLQQQGLLDEPDLAIVQERFQPTLQLPEPPKSIGEILLSLKNADLGYQTTTTDDDEAMKPLLTNVNLELVRGMKLLIRGPNGCGKSTLLHTLRGTLPLLQGKRIENDKLRLNVFTQDLAQELDITQHAFDIVTSYARTGPHGNIFVSNQNVRDVLGRLGLSGDKALRPLSALSGGEKARVALAMFALLPSNLYLLDEVSNHLDYECVSALQDALADWGDDLGAIVVISHDKNFCDKIGFTHVATIRDGTLRIEQRNTHSRDWDTLTSTTTQPTLASTTTTLSSSTTTLNVQNGQNEKDITAMDKKLRKQVYNAPKRIAKIETILVEKEDAIAKLDAEMLANGSDVGKLMDLNTEKEQLEAQVLELMEEWEYLEELLHQVESTAAA